MKPDHYAPALPSRTHGEEIAALLFLAAMERAKEAAIKRLDTGRATRKPRRR